MNSANQDKAVVLCESAVRQRALHSRDCRPGPSACARPWSSAAQAVYGSICCTVTDTTGAAIPKEHVTLTGLKKDPGKYDHFDYRVVQNVHAFARNDYVNLRLTCALVFGAVLGSGFVL
jgi:hypothetical protein